MNFYEKLNDNAVICCVTLIQHGLRVDRIKIIKKDAINTNIKRRLEVVK